MINSIFNICFSFIFIFSFPFYFCWGEVGYIFGIYIYIYILFSLSKVYFYLNSALINYHGDGFARHWANRPPVLIIYDFWQKQEVSPTKTMCQTTRYIFLQRDILYFVGVCLFGSIVRSNFGEQEVLSPIPRSAVWFFSNGELFHSTYGLGPLPNLDPVLPSKEVPVFC